MPCVEVVDSNKLLFTIATAMVLVSVFGIAMFLWALALMTHSRNVEPISILDPSVSGSHLDKLSSSAAFSRNNANTPLWDSSLRD